MRLLALRFDPGLGPGMPFRFGAGAGGARVLDGVLVPLATGADVDSDGFSEGGWSTGAATDGFEDEVDLARD